MLTLANLLVFYEIILCGDGIPLICSANEVASAVMLGIDMRDGILLVSSSCVTTGRRPYVFRHTPLLNVLPKHAKPSLRSPLTERGPIQIGKKTGCAGLPICALNATHKPGCPPLNSLQLFTQCSCYRVP